MGTPLKCWMVWLCLCAPLTADQYADMVAGLRDRQLYDYALLYLDQLAEKPGLPEEVRQAIPYERAITLQESSRVTRSPEQQLKLLDQALAHLELFVKESPNHPLAGDAHSQRAEILLGKARAEILQARLPANQSSRADFQAKARDWIRQARTVFEAAQKQYEESLQSYGTYIDKEKFPEKFEAREKLLVQLIMTLNNLGLCRYEEARTYDAGSPDFVKHSKQAAEQFQQIYQRYRNYPGGLYARLYEAKCFDEQGEPQKAMGIYNELLEHDSGNASLKNLQNKTLQFKLEALNRKQPPDAQVVIDLAGDWLKANSQDARTPTGLSIQWQQALGYEALGDQRDAGKTEKERNYRSARTLAQLISRFPGEYRDISLAMAQRLDGKLGGRDRKPVDFESAFSLAEQRFRTIQELRKELDSAKENGGAADEVKKLEEDLRPETQAAVELFETALNLAGPKDNPKNVIQARLWLAYVHFWARRNYEAAILGDYVAKIAPSDEQGLAIDGEYLALAAYMQAYIDTKGSLSSKEPDLEFVIQACKVITSRWPQSERAQDARIMAGRLYSQAKKPMEAAAWFRQIPESDSRYAEAQLEAGQGFWTGYLHAARTPADQRPAKEELLAWQTAAEQHLRTGMAKLSAATSASGDAPPELIRAKISLAEILLAQAHYGETIALLTGEPHAVTDAVAAPDESRRPPTGVRSRAVASGTYKILLRAYIGAGQLSEAQTAMKTLEQIAQGGAAGADITELYVGLGRMLKDDLDRLRTTGETDRFQAVRSAFDTFLNEVSQRKEGQTLGTLSWIGETYAAFGESETGAAAQAAYEKAANAFREMISQAEKNAGFATPDQLLAIKVRLAYCLRKRKDFVAAENLVAELLRQRKDDLKLQLEAARLYQDWGNEPGHEKKHVLAISGNPDNRSLGFGPLSKRLFNATRQGDRPDLWDTYLETRYQSVRTRYQYATAKSAAKIKQKELNNAKLEIVALARVTKDIPDERRSQFNELYRDVLAGLREPVVDLNWTSDIAIDPPPETAQAAPKPHQNTVEKSAPQKAEPPSSHPLLTYGMYGSGAVLGLGLLAWLALSGRKPRQPLLKSQTVIDRLDFEFPEIAVPTNSKSAFPIGPPTTTAKSANAGNPAVRTTALKSAGVPKSKPPSTP